MAVKLTDDDGGTDFDSLTKIVTNASGCAKTDDFWRHQFEFKSRQHVNDATLLAYLDIVTFVSAVFSEDTPASTIEQALNVTLNKSGEIIESYWKEYDVR